jgi:hypothetical protein
MQSKRVNKTYIIFLYFDILQLFFFQNSTRQSNNFPKFSALIFINIFCQTYYSSMVVMINFFFPLFMFSYGFQ